MPDAEKKLAERIEAGMRAGNLSWWEMELPSGRVVFDDRKAEMLGYSPEKFETYQDFTNLVHPEDYERTMQAMRDHLSGVTEEYEVEYRIQTKGGSYLWFRDVGAITERDDTTGYLRVIGIVEDITERKQAQESLRAALAQKDQLMRELNHRVKNSLHMALSLVSLKDDALGEKVDLSDIYHQIKAISTIHEKLHQEGSIEHIDLEAYIDDLLSDIFSFYSAGPVTTEVKGNGAALEPDTMVHIGLIVNELATNAMKYGFDPDEETPRFTVELYREGDSYALTIANTGNPFPENIDLESPNTLGLQLVSALAGQLGGTIDLIRKPHPVFTLRFPVSMWSS